MSGIDLAVIWSDFVQSIILIGSTALIIVWAICGTDGGFSGFLAKDLVERRGRSPRPTAGDEAGD